MNFDFVAKLNEEQIQEAIAAYIRNQSPEGYMCSTTDVELFTTPKNEIIAEVMVSKLRASQR